MNEPGSYFAAARRMIRPFRRLVVCAVAVSLLLPLAAFAGSWGERGISQRFITAGNLLYAADGRGVSVHDVSDPGNIRRIDVEPLDHDTYDLAFMGETVVIAGTSGGLQRLNVAGDGTLARSGALAAGVPVRTIAAGARYAAAASDLTVTVVERDGDGLRIVQKITTPHPVAAVAFVGDHLYIAIERTGTEVRLPPFSEAATIFPSAPETFALSGTTLWGGSHSRGLVAIDVSNPLAPQVVSATGGSTPLDEIAVAGNRVYGFDAPRTVRVFDVSNVRQPQLTATLEEWVEAIGASGSHFFISGPRIDEENLRYETGLPVRAFDASNPAAPLLSGELRDFAGPVSGVWTDGSIAYVVDPPFFRVLDVSKTDSPREIRSIHLGSNAQERVRVKNGTAIVYGRELVHILDVTNPIRPQVTGFWHPQGHYPSDSALLTPQRFVEANNHSGLHVVDYSNPLNPIQVGGRKWHYVSIAAGDDVVYAALEGHILVLEIADDKTVIDRSGADASPEQLEVSPPNARVPEYLLLREHDAIRIFSLADRFELVELTPIRVAGADLIGAGEGVGYFAHGGLLHRIDLSTRTTAATGMRVRAPMQISVAGQKVVVADRYSVRVYGPDTAPPPRETTRRRSTRH